MGRPRARSGPARQARGTDAAPGPSGRLRIAGRTGPLPPAQRGELLAALRPCAGEHPWPDVIPPSRFGQRPSQPVEYVQVEPTVVVEVDVDTSYGRQRWRHAARFVRLRSDLPESSMVGDSSSESLPCSRSYSNRSLTIDSISSRLSAPPWCSAGSAVGVVCVVGGTDGWPGVQPSTLESRTKARIPTSMLT